jgi:hypothetical protein
MLRKLRFVYLIPLYAYAAVMLTILSFVLAWDEIRQEREWQQFRRKARENATSP